MKFVISILMIAVLGWGALKLKDRWTTIRDQEDPNRQATAASVTILPGMPAQLEDSYAAAKKHGAGSLMKWLNTYRRNIRDPRLAAIELDYVVLVGSQNTSEARRILVEIGKRITEDSPVYGRFKSLENAYR